MELDDEALDDVELDDELPDELESGSPVESEPLPEQAVFKASINKGTNIRLTADQQFRMISSWVFIMDTQRQDAILYTSGDGNNRDR